jgi:hypothetical protein
MSKNETFEKREKGFALAGLQSVNLKEYNALYDPNMRHFFESRNNQNLLYRTGQIDSNGRIIDLDKSKSKLFILEREFKEAERIEERRQKEEMEMRVSEIVFWKQHRPAAHLLCICPDVLLSIESKEKDSTNWKD